MSTLVKDDCRHHWDQRKNSPGGRHQQDPGIPLICLTGLPGWLCLVPHFMPALQLQDQARGADLPDNRNLSTCQQRMHAALAARSAGQPHLHMRLCLCMGSISSVREGPAHGPSFLRLLAGVWQQLDAHPGLQASKQHCLLDCGLLQLLTGLQAVINASCAAQTKLPFTMPITGPPLKCSGA